MEVNLEFSTYPHRPLLGMGDETPNYVKNYFRLP